MSFILIIAIFFGGILIISTLLKMLFSGAGNIDVKQFVADEKSRILQIDALRLNAQKFFEEIKPQGDLIKNFGKLSADIWYAYSQGSTKTIRLKIYNTDDYNTKKPLVLVKGFQAFYQETILSIPTLKSINGVFFIKTESEYITCILLNGVISVLLGEVLIGKIDLQEKKLFGTENNLIGSYDSPDISLSSGGAFGAPRMQFPFSLHGHQAGFINITTLSKKESFFITELSSSSVNEKILVLCLGVSNYTIASKTSII